MVTESRITNTNDVTKIIDLLSGQTFHWLAGGHVNKSDQTNMKKMKKINT
jgi:hypothetical protein